MSTLKKHLNGWNAQSEYCLEYEHEGGKWALNFFAVDDEDAQKKVESIKQSLRLLGRLECVIEVPMDDIDEKSLLAALLQKTKPI